MVFKPTHNYEIGISCNYGIVFSCHYEIGLSCSYEIALLLFKCEIDLLCCFEIFFILQLSVSFIFDLWDSHYEFTLSCNCAIVLNL